MAKDICQPSSKIISEIRKHVFAITNTNTNLVRNQ